MDYGLIVSKVDHTLLSVTAKWSEIEVLCDEAMEYGVASVCIPPSYVKQAKEYVGNKMQVCTVIGFPNGYNTIEAKVQETIDAIANGADEIDMVINIGYLKDGRYDDILNEIIAIKEACGDKILKVIIETCLLDETEKIKMSELVTKAGAEYIKTSTGFSTGGATFADVELMREHVGSEVKVKAAGGISSLADADKFIELGADRLGTSQIIRLLQGV